MSLIKFKVKQRVALGIQTRGKFLDKEHFINETVKFPLTLPQNAELAFI